MTKPDKDQEQLSFFAKGQQTAAQPPERNERPASPKPTSRSRQTASTSEPARTSAGSDPAASAEPEVLTVATLDRLIKRALESATAHVRVRGEVSGLHRAGSGHLYFSLKDEREDALIECVMYRRAPAAAKRALKDGESVVLQGRATIYARRGRMQFVADDVLQTARGALLEALEKLKAKLAAEGLFAPERKKPLPVEPRCVAVLTSRDGAAIHDVVRVAFRRGRIRILLVPTPVQGAGAAERIADAIDGADRLAVDALIVTRGGGSAEDLAAYNDERVVRAIARATHPVVSAVGHEIDVSLSDLVADVRAATPSHAAEILVPDEREQRAELEHLSMRLKRGLAQRIGWARERSLRLERRLGEPRRRVLEEGQRFDELSSRLERCMRRGLAAERTDLVRLSTRLNAQHPRRVLAKARTTLAPLEGQLTRTVRIRLAQERTELAGAHPRLWAALRNGLNQAGQRLGADVARLDALSPLRVLQRGYAIATAKEGRALLNAEEVSPGAQITVRLHQGSLRATVDRTEPET